MQVEALFNDFMVTIFGEYRRFLDPDDEYAFDPEEFTQASSGNTARYTDFLQHFRESQMFEAWRVERTELALRGFPSNNAFESQVSAPFPSCAWPVSTEISPCHAWSCQEILRAETARQVSTAVRKPKHKATGEGGEFQVGYGTKGGIVRVEDDGVKGGWAEVWFDVDGDYLKVYHVDSDTRRPAGSPIAAIPCEFTSVSDPKSFREDAPNAFRIDVDVRAAPTPVWPLRPPPSFLASDHRHTYWHVVFCEPHEEIRVHTWHASYRAGASRCLRAPGGAGELDQDTQRLGAEAGGAAQELEAALVPAAAGRA